MQILKTHPAAVLFKDEQGFLHVREACDFASVPFDFNYAKALKYFSKCVAKHNM